MLINIDENNVWDTDKKLYQQSLGTQDIIMQTVGTPSIARTWQTCIEGKRRALSRTYALTNELHLKIEYIYNEPPDSNEFGGILDLIYTVEHAE